MRPYTLLASFVLSIPASAANVLILASGDPSVQRFIGKTGGFGAMLGLDPAWAFKIVKQVGNYAESFDRNIRPLGIERGLNRLWSDGGVMYVPALR